MKSVAVVGADGFIGSATVKGLIQNHYNPVSITRNSKTESFNSDIVFYVAGSSTPSKVADDSTNAELDLQSLIQFLNKLKNLKTRPLLVFASSAGTIYDPSGHQPYNESSPLVAANRYGLGKLAQEEIVRQAEWVDHLILRLSNIYGVYQKPKPGFGVIAHWAQKVCRNEPLEMLGNSGRDYLNVSDLVDLSLKIVSGTTSSYSGLTVNVGSGETVKLSELYQTFAKVAGRPIEVIKKPARAFDANSISIDISLAKELFNWQPKISLEVGIKSVLAAALQGEV